MNIAIIGYGRMGKEIEKIAHSRNHKIGLIIDKDNADDLNRQNLKKIDVAIEFTEPEEAFNNISRCLGAGVSVVSGTTGWLEQFDEAIAMSEAGNCAFMYASNYSIGVNMLFHMNRQLSSLLKDFKQYSVNIDEKHHNKKVDSPSGTAIKLATEIIACHDGYTKWEKNGLAVDGQIPIGSVREGDVPGIHEVSWNSNEDIITLKHEALSREGFALGAIIASEFINGKKGFLTMSDMLGF